MAKKATIILVFLAVITLAVLWKSHSTEPKAVAPQTPPAEVCLNNLRLIESGKLQWSLEKHPAFNQTPTWDDLRLYIGRGSNGAMPECPSHGLYTAGTAADEPACSIHGTLPAPR